MNNPIIHTGPVVNLQEARDRIKDLERKLSTLRAAIIDARELLNVGFDDTADTVLMDALAAGEK